MHDIVHQSDYMCMTKFFLQQNCYVIFGINPLFLILFMVYGIKLIFLRLD